jgi:hypothetical protein
MLEQTDLEAKIKETRKELVRKIKEYVYYSVNQRQDKVFKIRDSEYTVKFKEERLVETDPAENNDPRSQNLDLAPIFKQFRMAELARGVH